MHKHQKTIITAILLIMSLLVSCSSGSSAVKSKYPAGSSDESSAAVTDTAGDNSDNANDEANQDTDSSSDKANTSSESTAISQDVFDESDYYRTDNSKVTTTIKLNGDSVSIDGMGAEAYGSEITIATSGVYEISGTLKDGRIIIRASKNDTVQLVLNNASISCSDNSPIYALKAGKVIVTMKENTENYLADGSKYSSSGTAENEPNAVIFSKSDLILNGTGSLTIEANYNNAITGKDDLKIVEATLHVTSVDDGILGRDMVAIKGAAINISSAGDGIKSTNDKDTGKGNIIITDSSLTINSGTDGIQAVNSILIPDGNITITSGGGSTNGKTHTDNNPMGNKGNWNNDQNTDEAESTSTKGLKAAKDLILRGGTITIDSADDSLHSNATITIENGSFTLTSGDDAVHADTLVTIDGGTIDITKCYEGLESAAITMNGGDVQLTSSDDGINISLGSSSSDNNQDPNSQADCGTALTINGGKLTINASGDGLDSNGSIYMTGGIVLVNGPTQEMNGPLDYAGTFDISGGTLIAAGSSGMAQAPSQDSSQLSAAMTFSQTQSAGSTVYLKDSSGKTIASYEITKNVESIVFSLPELKKGESYTLSCGSTETGFTISDTVTWLNENGVTTGNSGFGQNGNGGFNRGGMRGGR